MARRLALLLAALIALAALGQRAVAAARPGKHAAAKHKRAPRIRGIVLHRGKRVHRAAASGNLAYRGGPVMLGNTTHAIFWEPSDGPSFPDGYEDFVKRYLQDVAADSNKATNVYSTDAEYYNSTFTHIPYSSSFDKVDKVYVDNAPLPPPPERCHATGAPSGTPCVTDGQLQDEVESEISAHGLPRGLGDVYFIFTPPGVASCFDSHACSTNFYCAYHSDFIPAGHSEHVLYANHPYPDNGCFTGHSPNANTDGDSVVSVMSHEHNETITDPLGDAWVAGDGEENGDKCNFVFGGLQGSGSSAYNQTINTHHYLLQQEWSNDAGACVQHGTPGPKAVIDHTPASLASGATASFDGRRSFDSEAGIATYSWSFDGGPAASTLQTPSKQLPFGAHSATLTVTDANGKTDSATVDLAADNSPACTSTSATVVAGSSVAVPLPCTDPDGADVLHGKLAALPAHGSAAIDDGQRAVIYTPAAGFVGTDSLKVAVDDSLGRSSAAGSVSIQVVAAAPFASAGVPHVGSLSASPRRVRAGRATTVSWSLDLAGSTTLSLKRVVAGRSVAGRCVRVTRRNAHARRCTRLVTAASVVRSGSAGSNSFRLTTRSLQPGSYRLVVVPRDAGGRAGSSRTLALTLLEPPRSAAHRRPASSRGA